MALFRNTNPIQGDGVPQYLGKLCQLFGGSPTNGDGIPTLLRKILSAVAGLSGSSSFPKRYVANLTQVGTAAPVAVVLENALGGTLVWTRSEAGVYVGTLAGAFPDEDKVSLFAGSVNEGDAFDLSVSAPDQIVLVTTNTGSQVDDLLLRHSIQVEVFP